MSSSPDLESTEDVCPHLGLAEDADSHATYATDAHRCHRLEKPTRIAPNHQERFCLVANHTSCPIYQGEGISATLASPAAADADVAEELEREPVASGTARLDRPGARGGRLSSERPLRPASIGPRPRPGGISMRNLTIGIFVLAAVVLAFSFWLLTRSDDENGGGIATNPTATETGTSDATTTPDGTTTPGTPGATVTGTTTPGDGTPTTSGGGGTYIVEAGDTCSGIAAANDVDLADLLEANNLSEDDCTALSVGQELVIP